MKITRVAGFIIICIIMATQLSMGKEVQSDGLPSLKGKKVLIVFGGWQGHNPQGFVDKVTPWFKAQGAILTISDSLGVYTNEKIMSETDLIIQSWTMGEITRAQRDGLVTAIKNGTGLAGCHGGTGDSFRNCVEFLYIVGGQWVAHPGGQIDYTVNITNSKDPITKGLSDFKMHSEQYYMLTDPNSKVLATSAYNGEYDSWIKGAVIPVAWKKNFGKGRVFYSSLGHAPEDFNTVEAWTLLIRGIRWASEGKYQKTESLVEPVY